MNYKIGGGKAQLEVKTDKKLALSVQRSAGEPTSFRALEKLFSKRSDLVRVEFLVLLVVRYFVGTFAAFINELSSQLLNWFSTGPKMPYRGN